MNSCSGIRPSVSVWGRLVGGGPMSGGTRGMPPIMGGGAPGGSCIGGGGCGWNIPGC